MAQSTKKKAPKLEKDIKVDLSYKFSCPIGSKDAQLVQLCEALGTHVYSFPPNARGTTLIGIAATGIRNKLKPYVESPSNTKGHDLKKFRFYLSLIPTTELAKPQVVFQKHVLARFFSKEAAMPMKVTAHIYHSEAPGEIFTYAPFEGAEHSVLYSLGSSHIQQQGKRKEVDAELEKPNALDGAVSAHKRSRVGEASSAQPDDTPAAGPDEKSHTDLTRSYGEDRDGGAAKRARTQRFRPSPPRQQENEKSETLESEDDTEALPPVRATGLSPAPSSQPKSSRPHHSSRVLAEASDSDTPGVTHKPSLPPSCPPTSTREPTLPPPHDPLVFEIIPCPGDNHYNRFPVGFDKITYETDIDITLAELGLKLHNVLLGKVAKNYGAHSKLYKSIGFEIRVSAGNTTVPELKFWPPSMGVPSGPLAAYKRTAERESGNFFVCAWMYERTVERPGNDPKFGTD